MGTMCGRLSSNDVSVGQKNVIINKSKDCVIYKKILREIIENLRDSNVLIFLKEVVGLDKRSST